MRRLLIANRGEIALRIIRTCRKLGIRTILVYSDPDEDSLALRYADERYPLGGNTPRESYLDIPKIIKAALETSSEAIHPGYGFLAEDPAFVTACEENGLIFVGPSSSALERLGNKLLARKTMREAQVPVIPGSDGLVEDEDDAVSLSDKIGYPLILKAVYGGGGRGMRIATNSNEVRRSYRITRAESLSAFGREDIYVEKRLTDPRHVEIQAIAGRDGKIVCLGERECSIQRRHQKLLEEAPSVAVKENLRERLFEATRKGLKASQYTNAGTMEFLLDRSGDFYFLEVNKRLQVEHLVTEMTTGIDIVEEQLAIAAGSPLRMSQNEVQVNGWAINCRINAEDPRREFTPSPGVITHFRQPSGPGIRIDSALFPGCSIPEYYDSMVAKLAAWGRNRFEAIQRMKVALGEIEIVGVPTTIPLHSALMQDDRFIKGDFHTNYLDTALTHMYEELAQLEKLAAVAVAVTRSTTPTPTRSEHTNREKSRWRNSARLQTMTDWRADW